MLLSIITINLNNDRGLAQTMASVAVQQNAEIDYIIIDGASIDQSIAIIAQYQHAVAFFASEKDSGIYEAMNKGIKAAKGDYVLFLNSGDTLTQNNTIARLQQEVAKIKADIYYTDISLIDEGAQRARLLKYPSTINVNYFINRNISHQAAIISKTLFQEIGYYNEDYRIVSDWAFFLKAAKHGYSFKYIDDLVLSNYILHGFSSDYRLGINERLSIIQSTYPEYLEVHLQDSQKKSLFDRAWQKCLRIYAKYHPLAVVKQRRTFNHYQLQRNYDLGEI